MKWEVWTSFVVILIWGRCKGGSTVSTVALSSLAGPGGRCGAFSVGQEWQKGLRSLGVCRCCTLEAVDPAQLSEWGMGVQVSQPFGVPASEGKARSHHQP